MGIRKVDINVQTKVVQKWVDNYLLNVLHVLELNIHLFFMIMSMIK